MPNPILCIDLIVIFLIMKDDARLLLALNKLRTENVSSVGEATIAANLFAYQNHDHGNFSILFCQNFLCPYLGHKKFF